MENQTDDSSVRVAVRIRPQISREVIDMCQICTSVTPGEPQVTLGFDKAFTYDFVFDTDDKQNTVYDTTVAELVESALEGYNATVLAYGQTGSGKTYTMGSGFDVTIQEEQLGIIPRAIQQLFDGITNRINTAKQLGQTVPDFKVMTQFMELYNEEVIDLFNPHSNKENLHKIHEDQYGGIQVKGITLKQVNTASEALQCLRLGALSRTTASTQMNTASSRSHAIFTLHVTQQRVLYDGLKSSTMDDSYVSEDISLMSNDYETLTAKFHFVDLAGSERLKRTLATGDRAKEGISINCGLLALGNVISGLGDVSKRAQHIPYRDSKLTRLLQDSLGGNSRTVMIACVSPNDRDFMETLNTLKYANRARNIKNRICVNQDKSSRTISQLRQQVTQLQLELIEYKQGKRIVSEDGTVKVNDMFYENNMLQGEINTLRTRAKAMQETIEMLNTKNARLISETAVSDWAGKNSDNDNYVTEMVHGYIKEIEGLTAKLIESKSTCEQLKKQINRSTTHSTINSKFNIIPPDADIPLLIEEAKKGLMKEKQLLGLQRSSDADNDSDHSDNNDESGDDNDDDDNTHGLKDELISLTSDIDMKQKLIEELELSHRRMQTMRQHYEDKLVMLQTSINNTQEERDKVLHSFTTGIQSVDKIKKIKDEYTKKINDMQKELKRLQTAQKEHARLLRSQSQHESQLKAFRWEVQEMKRAKVKLINKMKDESNRHKESEMKKTREIAQLRKETRKNANMIQAMETERRIKDQVLRRKQEEVSVLRKHQRRLSGRQGTDKPQFERLAKQKWLKFEKSINNISMSKRGIIEQEVRLEHFLHKREALGKELESVLERKRQAIDRNLDVSNLENYIEDLQENLNYAQESIAESQHNIIEIEESNEANESSDIKGVVGTINNIEEAKYLLYKLFGMTLSQSYAVAQRDAKLKETQSTMEELRQEKLVQEQLLDHMLHYEQVGFISQDMTTSVSSNAIDTTSSTNSSRSTSPVSSQNTADRNLSMSQSKLKMRRRTTAPAEMLYGLNIESDACPVTSQHCRNTNFGVHLPGNDSAHLKF